nr:hypothetical protein [Tanacetum cinerariifolium]
SQGKKTLDTSMADVDASEESGFKPARKRTASRRVIKKNVIIFSVNNIIPDLDFSLELEEDQSDDEEVDGIYSNEDNKKKDNGDDDKSIDLEMTDDEETEDEFIHGDEQVNDDKDEEIGSINNSSNTFICLHHTTYNSPNNNTNPYTIDALTITTTVPESNALVDVQLRVAKLEKDVSQMKKIDHSIEALAALKSQVLTVVEYDLRSKISHDLQKGVANIVNNHKRQHDDDDDDEDEDLLAGLN